jgi:hypothetical protein
LDTSDASSCFIFPYPPPPLPPPLSRGGSISLLEIEALYTMRASKLKAIIHTHLDLSNGVIFSGIPNSIHVYVSKIIIFLALPTKLLYTPAHIILI